MTYLGIIGAIVFWAVCSLMVASFLSDEGPGPISKYRVGRIGLFLGGPVTIVGFIIAAAVVLAYAVIAVCIENVYALLDER